MAKQGIFGPSRLVTRRSREQVAPSGKRQYAAAKVGRLTGDWLPVGKSVNDILRGSAPIVRNRVRQLIRDFPYFARAADLLVDWTVGPGTNFQSRVIDPDWRPGNPGSKFDRATCQKIEDAVAWGLDELDAAGRLHGFELERLAKREDVEAGEFLFVKIQLDDRRRHTPYALQAIEAEWLTDLATSPASGNIVDQGIEYDPLTGRAVAYHVCDQNNHYRARRIPAEYVLHGFDTRRSGQLRGISPFVSAVLIAHDLADYMDATIDTAKLAAKYLAMVTTPDPSAFQDLRTETDPESGRRIETLENAIIEYLRPGEDIKFAKNETPGATFDPFVRFVLRTVAVATGVPYSALAGNYADVNYTSLRGERQDILKSIAPSQARHARQFMAPVVQDIITASVTAGRLDLPGYFANPRRYWRGVYIPPGMEPIDPLREAKANRDDIAAGLRSPQEIAARRGRDIEEVLDELAEYYAMVAERGIPLETTSTALANNPAAVAGDRADRAELLKETD